jgi:hypothetical protein
MTATEVADQLWCRAGAQAGGADPIGDTLDGEESGIITKASVGVGQRL